MATRCPTAAPYRCTECGWTTLKWVGRCGECQQWGTVVESSEPVGITRSVAPVAPGAGRAARPITSIDTTDAPRRTQRDRRVRPGAGRRHRTRGPQSSSAANLGRQVDPPAGRSRRRARGRGGACSTRAPRSQRPRCGCAPSARALHDELFIAAETDLATILGHVDEVRPELLIVDSVQTVSSAMSEGMAGHPSQVREVASTRSASRRIEGSPSSSWVMSPRTARSPAGSAHPRAPRRCGR